MEHPPKQGLKLNQNNHWGVRDCLVLMEHPPKQGLKLFHFPSVIFAIHVLMEHPPKQGLKPQTLKQQTGGKNEF